MRGKFLLSIMALAIILPNHAAYAVTSKHHSHHKHRKAHAVVDSSAAYADIVIDAETGEILHATNADSPRHPASLTKMMTLYLTFQALDKGRLSINQYLPVSTNASEQSPTKLNLRAGQRVKVEDAILGIVTESANDAAMVLGEWLGNGDEAVFAGMMTRQARALGMTHTNFQNPTGLPDPDQITTARDMAVLGQALLDHFPRYYGYFSRANFVYNGANHPNHNHLMERYDGMDGIKTGYIRASGFNLVASAKHGDTRLIGVVFGGKSATARDSRMELLLDESFAAAAENAKEDQDDRKPTRIARATQADDDDNNDAPAAAPTPAPAPAAIAAPLPMAKPIQSVAAPVKAPAKPAGKMQVISVAPTPAPAAAPNTADDKEDYVALPKTAVPPKKPASATPSVVPKPSELTGDNWGVQIGAFSTSSTAQAALSSLSHAMPQLLGSAKPVVEPVAAGSITMYRARLMGIDPKTAQSVCAYMVQNKRSCLTVGP